MKSVMNHNFSQVPAAEIPRSTFNRSHGKKTTIQGDYLTPVLVDEALPGDTFNLNSSYFARLATPIKPIMDNIKLDIFYFAVPIRLVWDNWQKFNGEQIDPGDSTDYLIPQLTIPAGLTYGGLQDQLGIRPGLSNITSVSALFTRSYWLIWNEWFRDQNLQDSVPISRGDGPDSILFLDSLAKRNKKHDYFTSCLPWPQKGPSVPLPIGVSAPVISNGNVPTFNMSPSGATNRALLIDSVSTNHMLISGATVGSLQNGYFGNESGLVADLADGVASTINELRQAFQLQKLYERDARGGTRYTEIIRAHFGVVSPDARLQRPEYLGGGSIKVNIHPIAQNSQTDSTPQGNLAGMGIASGSNLGFVKSFTEHCIIIGLACPTADITYQQGLNKMFSRKTRWDFYWPALSHIGEQAVLQKEIFFTGSAAADDTVFGYQERYAEYRYKPSEISSWFRSDYSQTLDVWHLSQDFATAPVLNTDFITANSPWDRILAIEDSAHFILDCYHDYKCTRPMPVYSVPGLIDHF